jgi:hypothetical protein
MPLFVSNAQGGATQLNLLTSATATGAGTSTKMIGGGRVAVEATGVTTSGSGATSITIEVSNNNSTWQTAGTIGLTLGTTQTSDGFVMDAPWLYVRANVASISGTGASVSVIISA